VSLLTARELGDYLGVAPGTILDWWEQGRIPGFKFGRAVRFDLSEVLASGRLGAGGEVVHDPSHVPSRRSSLGVVHDPIHGGEK
jgi:excisionase family DNA binding protein